MYLHSTSFYPRTIQISTTNSSQETLSAYTTMAKLDESLLTDESPDPPPDPPPTIPRINQSMIHKHNGSTISIVGEINGTINDETSFQASDGGFFTVYYRKRSILPEYKSKFIEIRGIPDKHRRIYYLSHQEYGNNLDMKLWNKFVQLTQQYPHIF